MSDEVDPMSERRVCPRCEVSFPSGDFRGSVCGWCADDLERRHTFQEEDHMADQPSKGPRRETLLVKPTTFWRIDWDHKVLGGGTPQLGELELEATYDVSTDPALSLPDRFRLIARQRGRGSMQPVTMSRQTAADLYTALGEALDWDCP